MRPEQSGKGRPTAASIALEGGMRFLLANQGPDGLWRDFLTPAGEASEWPTGFVGAALQLAGADASALARAARRARREAERRRRLGLQRGRPERCRLDGMCVVLSRADRASARDVVSAAQLRVWHQTSAGERRRGDLPRAGPDPALHGRRPMDAIQRLVQSRTPR